MSIPPRGHHWPFLDGLRWSLWDLFGLGHPMPSYYELYWSCSLLNSDCVSSANWCDSDSLHSHLIPHSRAPFVNPFPPHYLNISRSTRICATKWEWGRGGEGPPGEEGPLVRRVHYRTNRGASSWPCSGVHIWAREHSLCGASNRRPEICTRLLVHLWPEEEVSGVPGRQSTRRLRKQNPR